MSLVDSLKAFNIQRTESEALLKADKDIKIFRSRQDSNLRGETPLDFESNALTTRPRLLDAGHHGFSGVAKNIVFFAF